MQMVSLIAPGQAYASGSGVRTACIEILNVMLAAWGLDGINVPSEGRTAFTVTASDGEYSVGSGANISIGRPVDVTRAFWMIDGVETELAKLTDEELAAWPDKTSTGRPIAFHYKKGAANGTLTLLPIPDTADSVVLYYPTRFTEYTAGSDNVLLPDYDEPIRNNLALRFLKQLSSMGAKMDPDVLDEVRRDARNGKADLQRLNRRLPRMTSDFPGSDYGGVSNVEFESGAYL